MARSDLLVSLVKAGVVGDRRSARNAAEALIADERAKQHSVLADRLNQILHVTDIHFKATSPSSEAGKGRQSISEVTPRRRLEDLILPAACRHAVEQVVEEQRRASLLRAHGLDPRHRLLLVGPPGNGKTSLAEAIAESLAVSFFVVRYETLIGSYLGETAGRLKSVFDYARTTPCVLFFDEFDAVGKERGDEHETGEIKRVVTSLLMQMDDLPAYTVVIAATNHAELLDRAVWRRFQVRLGLPAPSHRELTTYFEQFLKSFVDKPGISGSTLAKRLGPLSYAEAEEFTLDVRRRCVLALQEASAKAILEEQTRLWQQRVGPAAPESVGDLNGEAPSSRTTTAD